MQAAAVVHQRVGKATALFCCVPMTRTASGVEVHGSQKPLQAPGRRPENATDGSIDGMLGITKSPRVELMVANRIISSCFRQ